MPSNLKTQAGAPESVDRVLELLREQVSLYGRLVSFATRQRGLVSGEDTGPLLAMLADRRKLSQQLAEVGSRLAPVRQEWATFRDRLSNEQRSEAEQLLREAGERLHRVIASDEQDARVLSARKQSVAMALRKTHATGEAIQAYRVGDGSTKRLDCVTEDV